MNLPEETGVYLFYNKEGSLLYIGKAKNIRKRVAQHKKETTPWKASIDRVDFHLTDSEEEALLLEQKLVSQMLPRYNIRLRDDKSYAYIAISYDEEFPRVYLTREKHKKERRYFGPYINSKQGRRLVKTLARIFPFRSCQGEKPGREVNPCLDWHLGLCSAPCVEYIDRESYRENIRNIESILSGKTGKIAQELQEKMQMAAEAKEFERAALYRDRIKDLESISGKREKQDNYDALLFLEDSVFLAPFRNGYSERGSLFHLENSEDVSPDDRRASFLLQYYRHPPKEILLEEEIDPLTQAAFQRKYPGSKLLHPKQGSKKKFLERAKREALWKEANLSGNHIRRKDALKEIEKEVGHRIERIETYDASNLGKDSLYVSLVVFDRNGKKTSHYRVFSLKEQDEINDYLALETALRRRKASWEKAVTAKKRGEKYDESFIEKPDMILIDGGKGQLASARRALKGFLPEEDILSLAKREEEVYRLGQEVSWPPDSAPNLFLQEMRDEAHRFALKHNRRSRKITSPLEGIEGIGKKKRQDLEANLEDVESASIEELLQVSGVSRELAERIYKHFRKR